jgi:hypothetical protein
MAEDSSAGKLFTTTHLGASTNFFHSLAHRRRDSVSVSSGPCPAGWSHPPAQEGR